MLLGTITTATTTAMEVEKPIMAFGYRARLTLAQRDSIISGVDDGRSQLASNIVQALNDVVVTIEYVRKNGSRKSFCQALNLAALVEHNQIDEGFACVEVYPDRVSAPFGYITGKINLSLSGAIPFEHDETLRVEITTVAISKIDQLEIFTIEAPVVATDHLVYNVLSVGSDKTKVFPIEGYDKLLIPMSQLTATTELVFTYSNGTTVRMKKDELECLSYGINDLVYGGNAPVFGIGEYFVMDVSTVRSLEIFRQSTSALDFVGVNSDVFGDITRAVRTNENLKDLAVEAALVRHNISVAG